VRIDQFVPTLAPKDAIGSHVLNARDALRRAGFESDIWAEEIARPLRGEAGDFRDYARSAPSGDQIIVYHASIHSRMAPFLGDGRQRLVVDYHNITPSRFFAGWDPLSEARMDLGRVELRGLAGRAELALADSPYNQAELIEAGYPATAVCPIIIDYGPADPDPVALEDLQQQRSLGGTRWLFVGRLAPNKCQHDVIGAFAVYRRLFDSRATLTLVGGSAAPRYEQALHQLVTDLGLDGTVQFAGSIPTGRLAALYRTADVLVCLSEHEGFCVPIIEAMAAGVPVVAWAAAAVPDTAGSAALLLDDKDPLVVACTVDRLVSDPALRSDLVTSGLARARHFSLANTAERLVSQLSGLARRSINHG
jgi:glycosyltransferase involved in cell wall biosynthesis